MTTYEKKVYDICHEVGLSVPSHKQLLLDLVQEDIESLLHRDNTDPLRAEEIGAAATKVHYLLDVFDPQYKEDRIILSHLRDALDGWCRDMEAVNRVLNLPEGA